MQAIPHRVVAITGAARGIGLATATALLAAGYRVALGDLDGDAAAEVAGPLGPNATSARVDVTDPASFAAFLDHAEQALGPLDVLVNNAGIMAIGPFLDESDEVARRQFDVNVHGTLIGSKLALERLLPRGRGHIVNLASMAGMTSTPGAITYSGSKHAVVGITKGLQYEYHGSGVEFTMVLPGFVRTDLTAGARSNRGVRVQTPEDVASAIVEVLRKPAPQVFVPASLAPLLRVSAFLPRRVQRGLGAVFGVDRMFLDVDHQARRSYDERIGA